MSKIKDTLSHIGSKLTAVFRRDLITISDGTIVTSPKPIAPYIIIVLALMYYFSASVTGFSFNLVITRFRDLEYGPLSYFANFFPIEWSYWPSVVDPILETIQMSILGSFIGAVLALPASFLASNNMIKSKVVLVTSRINLSIARTLPILVYAVLLKLIFGPGALTGTIAIAIFTFSIVSKMLFEKIETIDLGAYEALQSTGASKIRSFVTAVVPEILPSYYSMSLYAFEINIRYAAILGYVGAGGIGRILNESMAIKDNNGRVIVVLLFIFAVVILIESLSRLLRRRLT